MTDKAPSKGWIARVTTKGVGGRPPFVGIYDAAIPGASDAVETVRSACGAGADAFLEIIAELPSGTDLRDGEVLLR
jgi:hypothetical protein